MSLGQQRGNSNPAATLAALVSKRSRFQDELRNIENQVYELETSYLQDIGQFGNAFKGFEGFLSSGKNTSNFKRPRKLQPEDRIFSLSSVTSPAAEELGVRRDDGRFDYGAGRSKGGNLPSNGHCVGESVVCFTNGRRITGGKPKRGRMAPTSRDGKRNRTTSEPDFDDEDDPDMISR
ncbi:Histone acetyltransferase subunit NuA4-domain-containing protein [Citrus sinensis]|uniref:Histone acetyltransferase subunit NuA4-domain-containing protein n=1 Tax=Citrus sinensis TaxID=2711 RepID=A0ACB8I5H6_CITSI|nr:Histone acetyltransferase subunit NuA4-domain-containing protein [Citrus sinensis]